MTGPASVQIKEGLENELGVAVLDEFDLRCSHLLKVIANKYEDPKDVDESAIEIEARVGVYDDKSRSFKPGVSASFFKAMREFLTKKAKAGSWMRADDRRKPVQHTFTDLYDVTFEDGFRVSCEVIQDPTTKHVKDLTVKEVITKRKLGSPKDFKVNAPQVGDRYQLRIGVACEDPVPAANPEYDSHARAARKAIFDACNVSTRVKIMGGIELTLKPKVEKVMLTEPLPGEQAARGRMRFGDPFYVNANRSGWLDASLPRQLKWTLLQPTRLPGVGGNENVELREPKDQLGNTLMLTNMVGVLRLPDDTRYAVSACQYVIEVEKDAILCGHGRFANAGSEANSTDLDLPIRVFRHKKRWAFKLRDEQSLDMTETRTSKSFVSIGHEVPVFEVELEKVLNAAQCREKSLEALAHDLKASRHAEGFLADIASRIFGCTLPIVKADSPPSQRWAEVIKADEDRKARLYKELSRKRSITEMRSEKNHELNRQEPIDDADQVVASNFYNQLNRSSQGSRGESVIYHMRCLNNFVKSAIIKDSLALIKHELGSRASIKILDLACGKGADIQKFVQTCREYRLNIEQYVGVDIARKSLENAIDRLEGMRGKPSNVRFIEADLGTDSLSGPPGGEADLKSMEQWKSGSWFRKPPSETLTTDTRFDLVSMQFALHYMFQSRRRAMHFFKTISQHMMTGGVFVATTVCSDEVIRRLIEAGPGKSEFSIYDDDNSEICNIKFDPSFRKDLFKRFNNNEEGTSSQSAEEGSASEEPAVGARYEFTLRDGTEESAKAVEAPEWLVPLEVLKQMAAANSLELKHYERLPNYAVRQMSNDSDKALFRRMNVLNQEGSISRPEWEIASLYVVVVLQKIQPPSNFPAALKRLKSSVPNFESLPEERKNELLGALSSLDD